MTNYKVRLIIEKEGLETCRHLLDMDSGVNILDIANEKKYISDLAYIAWNNINSEQLLMLENWITWIKCNAISYRLTSINESVSNIKEDSYTSSVDKKKNIPYPQVICDFDDIHMVTLLQGYLNNHNKTTENEVNYE